MCIVIDCFPDRIICTIPAPQYLASIEVVRLEPSAANDCVPSRPHCMCVALSQLLETSRMAPVQLRTCIEGSASLKNGKPMVNKLTYGHMCLTLGGSTC